MEYYPSSYQGISNSKTVTKKGQYALDAYQNNPSLPDTLAYEIKRIEAEFAEKLSSALEWKFIGMFDLETDAFQDISIPDTAKEVWFIIGEKNTDQVYGGISAVMPKYQNGRNIVAFGDVCNGEGSKIASKVYGYYTNNILRVRVREIVGNYHIATRVYYR